MPPHRQTGKSQLILADDHLVIDSPYDAAQVTDTKRIPGARWDKVARVWRVPMSSIEHARTFAAKWDLWIDPAVLTFTLPSTSIPTAASGSGAVSIIDDELVVTFPFDSLKAESAKRLPLTRWDADTHSFRAPLSVVREVCSWAERFNCTPSDEVRVALADLLAAEQSRIDASRAEDADIVVSGLKGELRPFQRAGVAYALKARRCFIADDMGLGKTLMSLAALEASSEQGLPAYPAVVICPATLTHNWRAEAHRWLPHRSVRIVEGRKEFPADTADITVVGWSNVAHWVDELSGADSYVFDESHYAKSHTAQRTKAAVKIAKNARGLVLCLTGTPVTNRPAEYVSQLEVLSRIKEFGGR